VPSDEKAVYSLRIKFSDVSASSERLATVRDVLRSKVARRFESISLRHRVPYLREPSAGILEIARRCGVFRSTGGPGESGFRVVRAQPAAISPLASEAGPFISNELCGEDLLKRSNLHGPAGRFQLLAP